MTGLRVRKTVELTIGLVEPSEPDPAESLVRMLRHCADQVETLRRQGYEVSGVKRYMTIALTKTADEVQEGPASAHERPLLIDELDLSPRPFNCLKNAGISTVDELTAKTEKEMLTFGVGIGRQTLGEIKEALAKVGRRFRE